MGNNIKGITVEIGGDTGPLNTALKGVNKTAGDLQNELKEVNRQLKFDPKNTDLLRQKEDLLKQSTQVLEEKQAMLKEAVSQAQAQFEKGDLGADKVRAVEREYEKVTSQLKDTKTQLNEVELNVGTFSEKVKAKFSSIKDSIKASFNAENIKTSLGAIGVAVTGLLKSATDSATTAEEKTDTISNLLQNQGLTADEASQSIKNFTGRITEMSSFSAGEAKDALQVLTEKGMSAGTALANSALLANVAAGSHKTLAESADLLANAYNGKTKALTALGILTKDEAKQLGDSENATISMADVQDRLNQRFGGAAAANLETYSGKLKENTNEINSAKTAIGTALLPILAEIADMAAKVLIPVANFIKENPKLTAAILAIIAVIGTLVGGLSLLTTVTGAFGITLDVAILPTIGLVVLAIAALAAGAILIVKNWSSISAFFEGIWSGIKSTFTGIGDWFKNTFKAGKEGAQNAWSGLSSWFSNLWSGIKNGIVAAWNGIKIAIMTVASPIINGVLNLWNSMKGGIETAFDGIKNIVQGAWEIIKNIIMIPVLLICDLVTGNFSKIGSDMGHIWANIQAGAQQVWNGIKEYFLGVLQAITGFFTTEWNGIVNISTAIWNGLKDFFTGLWDGIKTIAVKAWNGISTFFATFWKNEIQGWKNIINTLLDFFRNLPANFSDLVGKIGDAIIHGFDNAISFIKNLPAEALQWGKDIINGIVNGIKSAASAVSDAVSGIAQNIRSFLHFSTPDQGPLADFDSYMPDMMGTLASGITKNISKVSAAARQVASTVASVIPSSFDTSVQVSAASTAALNAANNKTDTSAKMGESIVNGMAAVMGNTQKGGTYTIQVLLDKKVIAETIFDPLKAVANQKGVKLA